MNQSIYLHTKCSQCFLSKTELKIIETIYVFIFPMVCLYGILVNLINAIIFSHEFYKLFGNLRFYLKINSIIFIIGYFFALFSSLSRYSTNYWAKFFHLYGYNFVYNFTIALSNLIHLSIALYQYLIITKKCFKINELSIKYVMVLLSLISVVLVTPVILSRRIEKETRLINYMNNTYVVDQYFLNIKPHSSDHIFSIWVCINMLAHNGFIVFLVVINILLLNELRKIKISTKKKFREPMVIRFRTNDGYSPPSQNELKQKYLSTSLSSKARNIIMVSWISLVFLSTDLMFTLYMLTKNNTIERAFVEVFMNFWSVFSFCLNFHIYYKTNLVFKKIFRKVFLQKLF